MRNKKTRAIFFGIVSLFFLFGQNAYALDYLKLERSEKFEASSRYVPGRSDCEI
jgi:hypothetical protein